MKKSAFVTGASGFIGSHLCEVLCTRGYEVYAGVRATSNLEYLDKLPIHIITTDLLSKQLQKQLQNHFSKIDIVFHIAGFTRGHTEQEYDRGNVTITRNLLSALAPIIQHRFVYISSLSAAGPACIDRPGTEEDELHPISHYGISKVKAEQEVIHSCGLYKCPLTIIRPPAVYGPRDGNFVSLFKSAFNGIILMPKGGMAPLSIVYVTDLVDGIILSSQSDKSKGQIYYISGQQTTLFEMTQIFRRVLNKSIWSISISPCLLHLVAMFGEMIWYITGRPQILSKRKIKDIMQESWAVSDEKARNDFGYAPKIDLLEGFQITNKWYRDNGRY